MSAHWFACLPKPARRLPASLAGKGVCRVWSISPRVFPLSALGLFAWGVGILAGAGAQARADVPLRPLALVPCGGMEVQQETRSGGAVLTFRKDAPDRRFLGLRARTSGVPVEVRSAVLRARIEVAGSVTVRPAALVFDEAGGSWVRVGNTVELPRNPGELRISLRGMRPTEFSVKQTAAFDWSAIREVWVGLVLEGRGSGVFAVESAALTDAPQHPTQPVSLLGAGAGTWTVHHDPAVSAQLTTPDGGPKGGPYLRVEFTFPGRRHMFCNSSLTLPAVDLEGYRALRLTYRAALPPGIGGLLVLFSEASGAVYRAEPMPPASAEWRTLEIPLDSMRVAEWSKDPDGKLDMGQVTQLWVGTHGVASGDGGPGWVEVAGAELVP